MMKKVYLGDSVYAEIEEGSCMIKLTTENGIPSDPSNTIYLEPEVVRSLLDYIKSWPLFSSFLEHFALSLPGMHKE